MHWEQRVEYAALTDIGFRRRNNQDAYAIQTAKGREEWLERGHLFLVADGMGGHAVGELASKIAADSVPHTFRKVNDLSQEVALHSAITAAHNLIHERGELNREFNRMGTTCTTLILSHRGAIVGHVGDSRCYRIRGDRLEQLTFDHSLQWELLRQGKMSPEDIFRYEPRNVITRSLGPQATVDVDIEGPYPVRPHDTYLLCSDGLCGQVLDEEIGMVAANLPPADACRFLVDLANLRGGPDNITVVIARIGLIPPGLPAVPPEPPRRDLQPGWGWFLSVAALAVLFVMGMSLPAFEKLWEGILLQMLTVLGMGGLLLAWLRDRERRIRQSKLPNVRPGNPYRTASAKLTPAFIQGCSAIDYHIQRTAVEEDWTVDWVAYRAASEAAQESNSKGDLPAALKHYARSIHIVMGGIQLQRKQKDLASRWGIRSTPELRKDTPLSESPTPRPGTRPVGPEGDTPVPVNRGSVAGNRGAGTSRRFPADITPNVQPPDVAVPHQLVPAAPVGVSPPVPLGAAPRPVVLSHGVPRTAEVAATPSAQASGIHSPEDLPDTAAAQPSQEATPSGTVPNPPASEQ